MDWVADVFYGLTRVYFIVIHLIFVVINFFIKKQHVPAPHDEIVMISATEAVKRIKNRQITPTQLVSAYIHRIEQVNPLINAAVVTLFDEAREIAAEYDKQINACSDAELDELLLRRPLFGVPFSCKDSLAVEGQIVTSGSWYRKDNRCKTTAVAVKRVPEDHTTFFRMQDAGGILIAITNVPEFCSWMETTNAVYGRSRNPYDTRRIVGGSSGGEGALNAAAATAVGVGSDVGGSIRIPSFVNGIFGLMPTPGVIPLDGCLPTPVGYKTQMLRVGPMCRHVEDIPLLLEIMAEDKTIDLHIDLNTPVDFKKCRIFYMFGIRHPLLMSLGKVMRETLIKAVSHFENKFDLEGICIDLPLATNYNELYSVSCEGNVPLSKKVLSMEDLLMFDYKGNPGTRVNEACKFPNMYTRIRDRLKRQLVELLGSDGVLFYPSWPCPAPFHNEPVFSIVNAGYVGLFNALALPAIQCPLGMDANGIPLGVQIVGAPGRDHLLIAMAKEISDTFGGWKPAWN